MSITCPHCHRGITLRVDKAKERRPIERDPIVNSPGAKRAVAAFAAELVQRHPGRWDNYVLRGWYTQWGAGRGAPAMTPQQFSINLRELGFRPWRHGRGRGFVIPETMPRPQIERAATLDPVVAAPSAQATEGD